MFWKNGSESSIKKGLLINRSSDKVLKNTTNCSTRTMFVRHGSISFRNETIPKHRVDTKNSERQKRRRSKTKQSEIVSLTDISYTLDEASLYFTGSGVEGVECAIFERNVSK